MPENYGTEFETVTEQSDALHLPQEGMVQPAKSPRELAKEVEEYFLYYRDQLQTPYRNIVKYWKLFLNELKDKRLPHEKWRAFVPVPYPWSITKVLAASFGELVLGQQPIIQPEGVGIEDDYGADKMSRLFDYIFRKITFARTLKHWAEEMAIQGVAVRKNSLLVQEREILVHPSPSSGQEFEESVAEAQQMSPELGEAPLQSPEEFEVWRQKAQELGVPVMEMPKVGPTTVRRYKGPGLARTSIFDLLFDPSEGDPYDLPCIIQHSFKPRSWLTDRTGPEPDKLFDPNLVAEGMGPSGEMVNEWHTEIQQLYGISERDMRDPQMKNQVEIWEAWMPGNKDAPYRVVLNREICINKNMNIPYFHGNHPYIFARNNAISGQMIGISEFRPVERMFYEMNTFRGLRLDALLMSILPVFVKAKEAGLTELQRNLVAGLIIETSRPDAVSQLTKVDIDPAIFREGSEFKNDIDEALGTMGNLRGKESAPRVPATSSERAFNTTFTRIKDRVIEFEGELSHFCPNSLFLCYQFWPSEHRVRVGGEPKADPFVNYKREDFLEALDADYAFRGARTAINDDMKTQNMKELWTLFVNSQIPNFKMAEYATDMIDQVMKQGSGRKYMKSEEEMAQESPPPGADVPPEEGAPKQAQGPPQSQPPQ